MKIDLLIIFFSIFVFISSAQIIESNQKDFNNFSRIYDNIYWFAEIVLGESYSVTVFPNKHFTNQKKFIGTDINTSKKFSGSYSTVP